MKYINNWFINIFNLNLIQIFLDQNENVWNYFVTSYALHSENESFNYFILFYIYMLKNLFH